MPSLAAVLLIALPWLNPFSAGPMPALVPLLFSWTCAVVLLVVASAPNGWARSARLVRAVAGAWLLAALLSVGMGLLQYFGKGGALDGWINGAALGEAFANLRQRNHFSSLTNIGLAALVWWVGTQSNPKPWVGWVGCVVAVLLASGNAASSSRIGLMELLLLIALAWHWTPRQRRAMGSGSALPLRVLVCAAVGYGVASAGLPVLAALDPLASGIFARLNENSAACAGRLTLWSNILVLIAQKPGLGWGWGELDYAHFVFPYAGERFCDILDNAHNLPLHLAVELGVPLALGVCSVMAWLVWRAKPWRECDGARQLAWSVLAVVALHSLVEYPLWYGPFQMAAALSLWLLWSVPGVSARSGVDDAAERQPPGSPGVAFPPTGVTVFAVVALAAMGFAAWDYWRVSQLYLLPQNRAADYRDATHEKVRGTRLFQNQVQFAELTTTPVTPDNADRMNTLALELLHFSPEPRVIEKVIESAVMLGRNEEAVFFLARYRAAFPDAHANWQTPSAGNVTP